MLPQVFNGALSSLVIVVGLPLSLSIPVTVNAEKGFCPEEASVNLTNAKQNASGYLAESGHFFPIEIVRNEEDGLRGCMCDVKPCVSICPPLRDEFGLTFEPDFFWIQPIEISMFNTTSLNSRDTGNLPLEAEKWFHFFTWDVCMDGNYFKSYLKYFSTGKWHIFKNGSFFMPREYDVEILLDWREYCLWRKGNHITSNALICVYSSLDPFDMVLFIGEIISVPLLIATIFVYSVLPQLKNIHGKTLSRYLGCLLVINISRVIQCIYPSITYIPFVCLIFEFSMYFLILTSFLWLNIMCFDMWWRFGLGYGSIRNLVEIEDSKKLIGYSIYAWGTPVIISVICYIFKFFPGDPYSEIMPIFRKQLRWTSDWFGQLFISQNSERNFDYSNKYIRSSSNTIDIRLLYPPIFPFLEQTFILFSPVFLFIICNTCLFVLTSIKLIQHQRNTRRQLSSGDSERHDDNQLQLLSVCLKLFVIMGISWPTILIWMFWDPPIYVRYVTILLNELQGIPIFVVLVCKKTIWQSLKMRFKW